MNIKATGAPICASAKKVCTIALVFICIFSAFNKAYCQNQAKGLRYFTARAALIADGYTICEDRYSDLSQGDQANFYRTFYHNTSYKIIAISDDTDVKDIDIFVYYYDSNGEHSYTSDNDESAISVVKFTPYIDRYLKVVYKNYASRTPYYESTVRLLVGYKG